MSGEIFVNQQQLAHIFDVSRSTLTEYGNEGLPFEVDGAENRYRLGLAGFWIKGRTWLKARRMDIPSAPLVVMLGRVLGLSDPVSEPLGSFDRLSREFMSEHFGLDGRFYDQLASQAFRLAMD